ncbi:MAG TPA: magnesium transporter CorA family protein [Nitrososphaeraceae archaeon]|nr:magnesium transporter CorA family protein [Nitrososphaeraceae archaeon]
MTISSYIINARTIRPVNVISEGLKIREEMKKNAQEYLWVHANEIEDIFSLQDMFGLHPLTVEAILHQNQPSKIEEYDRYLFAVIDGIVEDNTYDKTIEERISKDKKLSSETIIEDDLYMYLEKRWIITINFHNNNLEENIKKNIRKIMQQQQTTSSRLSTSTTTTFSSGNKERFDNNKSYILKKSELIFRLAIEEMIQSYYPILDNMNKDLEQTEDDILDENISRSNKNTKSQLSQILILRKKISFIELTLGMISRAIQDFVNRNNSINDKQIFDSSNSLDGLPTISSNNLSKIHLNPDTIRNMHSMNDRIRYLRNDVENMHQRIISLRETYNSSLSANLNETIRTLTVIATIVLPLTLITGIYGMNFEFMPELTYEFGYFYALGLIAAVGGTMVFYFKRKRWM